MLDFHAHFTKVCSSLSITLCKHKARNKPTWFMVWIYDLRTLRKWEEAGQGFWLISDQHCHFIHSFLGRFALVIQNWWLILYSGKLKRTLAWGQKQAPVLEPVPPVVMDTPDSGVNTVTSSLWRLNAGGGILICLKILNGYSGCTHLWSHWMCSHHISNAVSMVTCNMVMPEILIFNQMPIKQ